MQAKNHMKVYKKVQFVFVCSCFGSTGEASNVDEYLWLMGRAHYKPIIEYCGGTEIGGGFVTGSLLQAQSLAAFSTPAMGCTLFILGDDGYPIVSTFEILFCFCFCFWVTQKEVFYFHT